MTTEKMLCESMIIEPKVVKSPLMPSTLFAYRIDLSPHRFSLAIYGLRTLTDHYRTVLLSLSRII